MAQPRPASLEDDARVALLRREQQLDAIQRSLGWRLLSYYGPYKRRFVVPLARRVRAFVARWLRIGRTAPLSPYEDWAQFAERVHDVAGSAGAVADPAVVSFLMTVDERSVGFVDGAVQALRALRQGEWQLHVAYVGDGEGALTALPSLTSDSRIDVDARHHATQAAATGALVTRARAAIVATLPPAVMVAPHAVSAAARAFAETTADVVYCDEDLCDGAGRREAPQLKPAWSPDLLLSWLYWSRLVFYRRTLLDRVLPLSGDAGGAHLYDLALRVVEQQARIVHLPRILAHVRTAPTATGGDAPAPEVEAGRRVLESALQRRRIAGSVHWETDTGVYRVQRTLRTHAKISIVIPTRDGLAMLERCLRSIEVSDHPSFEIVIVDNGSVEDATLAFLNTTRHRVIRAPGPFNFSRLNNVAVAQTKGQHLVFLNNDTEACGPDWLRALEEHADRPEVGAVGAKLLYPNGTIQHAGIAIGIGGLAGHPHRFQSVAPPEGVRNVSAVTGACLMMRRETFEAVGGFDERLPVNSNDVDLCLRVRARGYLVIYTPHAVLYHYESKTRGLRAVPDDAWLMTRRWREILAGDPYYNPNADLAEETGAIDLGKPDGMTCLYGGASRGDGSLHVGVGARAGQGFFASGADLCAVVVRGVLRGDRPHEALRFTLRESLESTAIVRVVERFAVGRREDELWFCFEPLRESAGREWYFSLEVREGHALALSRTAIVSDVMGPCFENDAASHGALVFQLYARAPYRCATSTS